MAMPDSDPAVSPLISNAPLTPPHKGAALCLLAGLGHLPLSVVQQAKAWGWRVVVFCIHSDNHRALKKIADEVVDISPGLLEKNFSMAKELGLTHGVMAGKVNKWQLFCNPRLDKRALDTLNTLRSRSDDNMMLTVINLIEVEGFKILPQTAFLQAHFLPAGQLAGPPINDVLQHDIHYGCHLAKTMAGVDVGQTVVVHNGMVLAVEAIEGTDKCLKRAGDWAKKKGGVVVKVAKPNQDPRFDVPTVGLKTLEVMKKAGLTTLVTEASQTFFLEPEAMKAYAHKHGMTITSVDVADVLAQGSADSNNTVVAPTMVAH